jgi:lipopolysaccharide biosynthesis glycosyltransferase
MGDGPETDRLDVACAVVGDYLPHAAAMVASLVDRGGEPAITLHLLHDGCLPPDDLLAFHAMLDARGVELRSYEIADERLDGVPTAGYLGKGSWYRIFLPELVPDVGRFLYLDVDLLVLDAVTPLRDVDVSDAYLAAVTNVFEPSQIGRAAELGLSGPDAYFNAGVLLMNVEAMRRDGCTAELLRYARENPHQVLWRDQDALNVVLGEGRVHLAPRWNCMNSVVEFPHSVDVFGPELVA